MKKIAQKIIPNNEVQKIKVIEENNNKLHKIITDE